MVRVILLQLFPAGPEEEPHMRIKLGTHSVLHDLGRFFKAHGSPLDVIARMLGHAKTETTERRYVKYRTDILENVRDKMG